MEVRLQRSSSNALTLAEAVAAQPSVKRVHYPGLAQDPRHAVAARMLCNGYGSILAVDFDSEAMARRVVDGLQLIQIAETLGGVMTTVVLPKVNYYRGFSDDDLRSIGVSAGLVRLSVGIECVEDLVSDLLQAMKHAE
jgi:cystathionine beta-lyase/cystathionine gamma-synthase